MEYTGAPRQLNFLVLVCLVGLIFVDVAGANVKTANGTIKWDSLPAEPKYNTSTEEPHLTFNVIFAVASEFIHAVAPVELPWELLRGIIKGTVDPLQDYTDFVNYSAGFVACFAVALVFVVIMPITGLIFCCCRCCENCGGKMLQRDKYNTTCRRVTFGLVLLFITALMTLGLAGVIMANSQMSTSANDIKPTIDTNIDDIGAYIRQTFIEFDFLATRQFTFLSTLIFGDLFHIDKLVGKPVRDNFARRVDPALGSVYQLGIDASSLQTSLKAVNRSVNQLMEKGIGLQEALDLARNDINATLQSIECLLGQPCLKDELDLDQINVAADFRIIDVEAELNLVNDALKINITDKIHEGQQKLDTIPDKITNGSQDAIKEFRKELEGLQDQVQWEVGNITYQLSPEIEKFLAAFSTDTPSPEAQNMYDLIDLVLVLDRYRFYVGIALACIIFIVILCNFVGMMFGECGRDKRDRPTERGCLSNFGGTLLLTGVAFSFIFSAFIMILTTLCFLLGGVSEKVICEPVTTRSIFREVIDYPYLFDQNAEYWLSDNLFGKGKEPLTVESLIISCEINQTLYKALRLGNIFNITAALDYKMMYPDIETKLDGITVDLSGVDILDGEAKTALTKFIDSGVADANYTKYLEEIRKGITRIDLPALATQLEEYAVEPLPYSNRSKLLAHATVLRGIQMEFVEPMQRSLDSLKTNLESLLAKAGNLKQLVNESLVSVQETQDYIHMTGPELFREALEHFVDGIIDYVDQYVTYVLTQVNNNVGVCKPVANLYDSLEVLVCNNLVYAFNGFWLCLGWCVLLFIPSIIFAVKLSKFYRRMRFYEDYYNAESKIPGENYGDVVRLNSLTRHGNDSYEDLRVGHDNEGLDEYSATGSDQQQEDVRHSPRGLIKSSALQNKKR